MPEIIPIAVAFAGGSSAAAAAINIAITVASPVEDLVFGDRHCRRSPDTPAARRRVLLASEIGLRVEVPHGPNAYVAAAAGACLEPHIRPGDALLVDPDQVPKPGDFVSVWFRDDRAIAVRNERGRQTLLTSSDFAEPDDDVVALMSTHQVVQGGAWSVGKRLVRPLPPRERWATDSDFGLVVEMTNPAVELRTHLANVLAVDRVLCRIDLGSVPEFQEVWETGLEMKRGLSSAALPA